MIYAFGEFELDGDLLELRRAGERVAVQPKVLDLLFLVVRAGERVVTKREIRQALWPGITVNETALARAVMGARRAIGDEAQQMILTVRARGFRFAVPVTERTQRTTSTPAGPALLGRDACLAALGTH